jgi:hypothetical protein
MVMSKKYTKFGLDLMEALKEVKAHRRGEIYLPTREMEVALETHPNSATLSAPNIDKQIAN